MKLDLKRISEFSTEEFIDFVYYHDIKKEDLIFKIENSEPDFANKESILRVIEVGYNRIKEPLEFGDKILYLFFPFGYLSSFFTYDQDIKRFRKYRYKKRIKQYWIFSSIGMILYTFAGYIISVLVS